MELHFDGYLITPARRHVEINIDEALTHGPASTPEEYNFLNLIKLIMKGKIFLIL